MLLNISAKNSTVYMDYTSFTYTRDELQKYLIRYFETRYFTQKFRQNFEITVLRPTILLKIFIQNGSNDANYKGSCNGRNNSTENFVIRSFWARDYYILSHEHFDKNPILSRIRRKQDLIFVANSKFGIDKTFFIKRELIASRYTVVM